MYYVVIGVFQSGFFFFFFIGDYQVGGDFQFFQNVVFFVVVFFIVNVVNINVVVKFVFIDGDYWLFNQFVCISKWGQRNFVVWFDVDFVYCQFQFIVVIGKQVKVVFGFSDE